MGQNASNKYGRIAFTVQESVNGQAYAEYKSEKLTMDNSVKYFPAEDDDGITVTATLGGWLDKPAKKIVLYNDGTGDDTDYIINLYIDDAFGDNITLDAGDLPLTIEGLLIKKIKIISTDDVVACLSFH